MDKGYLTGAWASLLGIGAIDGREPNLKALGITPGEATRKSL